MKSAYSCSSQNHLTWASICGDWAFVCLFVGSSCANNGWHRSHLRQSHVKRQEYQSRELWRNILKWACERLFEDIFSALELWGVIARTQYSLLDEVQSRPWCRRSSMRWRRRWRRRRRTPWSWRRRCFEWENIYCVAGQWPPLKYKWKLFTVDTLCLTNYTNHFGASLNVKTSSFEKPFEGHFSRNLNTNKS